MVQRSTGVEELDRCSITLGHLYFGGMNERGGRHNTPHIHAIYQDHEAAIALDGTVIEGSLPSKKMKLVVAWIEIHAEELFANWKLLSDGQEAFKIPPLR